MTRLLFRIGPALLLALAACAPSVNVRTDFDGKVAFKTFRFEQGKAMTKEGLVPNPNTLVDRALSEYPPTIARK